MRREAWFWTLVFEELIGPGVGGMLHAVYYVYLVLRKES